MGKLDHFNTYTNRDAERKPMSPSEGKLQAACVHLVQAYYKDYIGRFVCINNNSENSIKGAQNKAMGVREGASDTFWLKPNGATVWIEFKRNDRTGRQSKQQRDWQRLVEGLGHRYVIVESIDEFFNVIGLVNPEPDFKL